jgi:2-phosphosulfolactate phosphatase
MFEWGEAGVQALAPHVDVLVIVDVLSFSTAVSIAVERGARVYPYRWRDDGAAAYAERLSAHLAVSRQRMDAEHPLSLSPGSMRSLSAGERVVLPSPNGATLAALAAEAGVEVLAGCLRNASAVAGAVHGRAVGVVAAGERWRDGSLRPAIEDLIGAGAILARLPAAQRTPEAEVAIAAYAWAAPRLEETLRGCMSGQELIDIGYAEDVAIAAELDTADVAPRLRDGAFSFAA